MHRKIVALSGRIASGKSTLAAGLAEYYDADHVSTRELIGDAESITGSRESLQVGGDDLDGRTKGEWVAKGVVRRTTLRPEVTLFVVDSVRIKLQIDALRRAFGPSVFHVHLTAPDRVLERRYRKRRSAIKEASTYSEAGKNKTEARVESLRAHADLVIDTSRNTATDILVRVSCYLGLYGRGPDRLVDILVGGQYGSEGKGQIAAHLSRSYQVLFRVGGPNAGHKVFGYPPRTYYHLPAGTDRNEDATVVLGPGAVIWPPRLLEEMAASRLAPGRLCIDPNAMIITVADRSFEKKTLEQSIGSTAQGVGVATARRVLRGAWRAPVKLARDVPDFREYLADSLSILERAYSKGNRVFLEGTQGSGLSLFHGAYPHVTSRDTTVGGCLAEAGIAPSRIRRIVMVCRSYPIRVANPTGASSGDMSREISWEEISRRCDYSATKLRRAERTSTTNRRRRVAEFNWSLFRRSVSLNGPTDIALTFADYIGSGNQNARRFDQLNSETRDFIAELERIASAPVSLIATRFHFRSVIDRRDW